MGRQLKLTENLLCLTILSKQMYHSHILRQKSPFRMSVKACQWCPCCFGIGFGGWDTITPVTCYSFWNHSCSTEGFGFIIYIQSHSPGTTISTRDAKLNSYLAFELFSHNQSFFFILHICKINQAFLFFSYCLLIFYETCTFLVKQEKNLL